MWGCPGGDKVWLNTRVIVLGNNSEFLSFACCLKAGKRYFVAFSGLFLRFSQLMPGLLMSFYVEISGVGDFIPSTSELPVEIVYHSPP